MPPIILVGLIISAIYLLFNNDEEKEEKKDEAILAHDARSRSRVRRTRLVRKRISNGSKPNRSRVRSSIEDMPDEKDDLINEPEAPRQAVSGEKDE